MNKDEKIQHTLEDLTREAVDQQKIIEFGWVVFAKTVISPMAGQTQLDQMRLAFFAGAQHLFASIVTFLDPDAEPTAKDLERMDQISNELSKFVDDYKQSHLI